MSQVFHTASPLTNQIRNHWVVALSALLALLATIAVVLALAIDGGSTRVSAPVAQSSPEAARTDGGPDESAIAAAIGSARGGAAFASRPDESKVAAALGSASGPARKPSR